MFIPTKSDDQIFINLRKTNRKKKKNLKFYLPPTLCSFRLLLPPFTCCFASFYFYFYFSLGGTHKSLFLHFSLRFSPETIYFVPVSISFIIIEYSLNICHFFRIFQKSCFQVSLYTRCLEIRKIFRLSRN